MACAEAAPQLIGSSGDSLREAFLAQCTKETGAFVTAEDHTIYGGIGGAVAEAPAHARPAPIEFVAVNDRLGEADEPAGLARHCGLGAHSIADAARPALKRKAHTR